jgi:hypothetical protein
MEPETPPPVPRTLDLTGLSESVARAVVQFVDALRGKPMPPPGVPRVSILGRFEEPGKTIPPELLEEARAELWGYSPRPSPEASAGT